jgi:hypothetical protein
MDTDAEIRQSSFPEAFPVANISIGVCSKVHATTEFKYCVVMIGRTPLAGLVSISTNRSDSWTAVVKGATLMGLGVGCEIPAPNSSCHYHVGVVLAERFTSYSYAKDQQYMDTFDHVLRARDHIKWVVAKDDLVTPHEGIEKRVKIIHKVTPKGKKAGRIVVVLSGHEEAGHGNMGQAPSRLSELLKTHDSKE